MGFKFGKTNYFYAYITTADVELSTLATLALAIAQIKTGTEIEFNNNPVSLSPDTTGLGKEPSITITNDGEPDNYGAENFIVNGYLDIKEPSNANMAALIALNGLKRNLVLIDTVLETVIVAKDLVIHYTSTNKGNGKEINTIRGVNTGKFADIYEKKIY